MEFNIVESHMGKLIGIQLVNKKFTVGQILYNTNKNLLDIIIEL